MFDISSSELLAIGVVALLVFGPNRLPELLRGLGKITGELRKTATELRAGIEAEVSQMAEPAKSVGEQLKTLGSEITAVGAELVAPAKAIGDELKAVGKTEGETETQAPPRSDP